MERRREREVEPEDVDHPAGAGIDTVAHPRRAALLQRAWYGGLTIFLVSQSFRLSVLPTSRLLIRRSCLAVVSTDGFFQAMRRI